jgi:hypothetical protein
VADGSGAGQPDPVALRDGYEQLRERVLTGRPDGWRLGHAVLARRGMAGWIAAQTALASRPPGTPPLDGPPRPAAAAAAPALAADCGQIVAVLAEMALAHAA